MKCLPHRQFYARCCRKLRRVRTSFLKHLSNHYPIVFTKIILIMKFSPNLGSLARWQLDMAIRLPYRQRKVSNSDMCPFCVEDFRQQTYLPIFSVHFLWAGTQDAGAGMQLWVWRQKRAAEDNDAQGVKKEWLRNTWDSQCSHRTRCPPRCVKWQINTTQFKPIISESNLGWNFASSLTNVLFYFQNLPHLFNARKIKWTLLNAHTRSFTTQPYLTFPVVSSCTQGPISGWHSMRCGDLHRSNMFNK